MGGSDVRVGSGSRSSRAVSPPAGRAALPHRPYRAQQHQGADSFTLRAHACRALDDQAPASHESPRRVETPDHTRPICRGCARRAPKRYCAPVRRVPPARGQRHPRAKRHGCSVFGRSSGSTGGRRRLRRVHVLHARADRHAAREQQRERNAKNRPQHSRLPARRRL